MKKLLLIFLICLPLVSATNIHSGWHSSGETFTVDGDEYYVFHEYEDDKVLISFNNKTSLIKLGKCFENSGKEICFIELDEDLNSDRVTYEGGIFVTAVKITIDTIGPDVSITKTALKTSLKVDETTTVSVSITNKGNRPVDRFTYVDIFPPELRVLESSAGTNKYEQTGNIAPGQTRALSFTVEAQDDFESFVSQGNLTYTYDDITKNLLTSSLSFIVDTPYDVDIEVDEDEIDLDEDITYEVAIENVNEEELEIVSMELFHPNFRSSSVDNDNITSGSEKLIWKGFLDSSESMEFKTKLQPLQSGEVKLILKIVFEYERKKYDFVDEKIVTVISDEPVVEEPEPEPIETGSGLILPEPGKKDEVKTTVPKNVTQEKEEREPLFKESGPGIFTKIVDSIGNFFKWLFD